MKAEQNLFQRLTEGMDLAGEPIPGQSVVELTGGNRVLIENHHGMTQYSRERICVRVQFGMVAICGCGLELSQMTKEQLIVTGRVDNVTILRRKS